ncbi:bacillithiol biosynthesis deacetylase BshB1 [Candidatus Latescibacterota bacterium]
MSKKLDVLCMVAHPDDAEILSGGTLIKLKDQGYSVGIVDFSKGEMGTRGTPEQRAKEAQCAAEIMGVDVRVNLEFPDARIENTIENRTKVVRAIREYRPHLIITHGENNRNPDHTHTSYLVKEAAFTSGLTKYDTGQDPHRPNKIIYCIEYFEMSPTFHVDITDQYERKMNAISCYRSQTFDPDNTGTPTYIASDKFLTEMDARFRYYGSKIHKEFGEIFRMDSPVEIKDIVSEVGLRSLIPGQSEMNMRGSEPK